MRREPGPEAPPPLARRFEREVRSVLVGGLVFALFLAGASLVVMRNTALWAERESLGRVRAASAAVLERIDRAADPSASLGADSGVAAILRESAALAAALYAADGSRLSAAGFLPEPSRVPATLAAGERPRPGEVLVLEEEGGAPALRVLSPGPGGDGTFVVVHDAAALFASRRNAAVLLTVVPIAAAGLTLVVALFLRRLVRPMEALAETARDAVEVVPARGLTAGSDPEEAIATFARTIDELKKRTAELDALRRREQERADALQVTAETLVRSHPGGLLVIDAGGRLAQANAPALDALGLDPATLGAAAVEVLAPFPPIAAAARSAAGGVPTLGEEFEAGDGLRARRLALTAVPVADAERRPLGTLVFLEDRTTTTRLQRELSARRELAALGEMSAGIAHEFRNATATILGYARLASGAAEEPARQRHLAAIRAEAQHVARVTGDFLFFARPEALSVERVSLASVVEEVLEEERVAAPGVLFETRGEIGVAVVDAALFRRALVNLLRNACEAAGERAGGGRVLVSGGRGDDGTMRLAVEDDGPGVPDEEVSKLFVPFYSTKQSGTGLGLALVARIVGLHGGAIAVERSRELGGARFVVSLPA